MRIAALPALIVGTVLQATLVRPLHVPSTLPNLSQASYTEAKSFEEQEEPDDEFEVRLALDEVKAAATGQASRLRKTASPILDLGVGAAHKFYINDTADGLGSRILNVIGALVFAERMNLQFAGVVAGIVKSSHYVDIPVAMQTFFGLTNVSDLYIEYGAMPRETRAFPDSGTLAAQLELGAIEHGVPVFVEFGNGVAYALKEYTVSETVLSALRSSSIYTFQMPLSLFPPSDRNFNVAVHVRRGDVTATTNTRGTTAEYYMWLMNIMRSQVPYAKFHVFSERAKRGNNSDEFDQYSKWGATVHVDTEARETLAHMARADVLVTARSSFSYAAAYMNSNCVLNQMWLVRIPPLVRVSGLLTHDWVPLPKAKEKLGNDEIEALTRQIGSCMLSVAAAKSGRR